MKNAWLAAAGAFILAFFMALKSFAIPIPAEPWSECPVGTYLIGDQCLRLNLKTDREERDVGRDRSKDQPPLVRCCDAKDCHECGKVSKDEDE